MVRRLIDVVFCLLLAVLVVPMVVIALAIWAEDKQPTLFRRNEWGCVATVSGRSTLSTLDMVTRTWASCGGRCRP